MIKWFNKFFFKDNIASIPKTTTELSKNPPAYRLAKEAQKLRFNSDVYDQKYSLDEKIKDLILRGEFQLLAGTIKLNLKLKIDKTSKVRVMIGSGHGIDYSYLSFKTAMQSFKDRGYRIILKKQVGNWLHAVTANGVDTDYVLGVYIKWDKPNE